MSYKDFLIINLDLKLNLSFSESKKKFCKREGSFNVFGIIPNYGWDTDNDRLIPHGQIIFDRTSGGQLVTIKQIPKVDDLIALEKDKSLLDVKTFIKPGGYNRLLGGSVFALFLYIIQSRYFPDLNVSDDYYVFKDTSAMVLDFDLHSTLMDDNLTFDECFNHFEHEYQKKFPPKEEQEIIIEPKKLSDYFEKLPTEPIEPDNINLNDIKFSVRTQNVLLKQMKIKTIADLLKYSASDLLKVKNMSRRNVKEINEALEFIGLKFLQD